MFERLGELCEELDELRTFDFGFHCVQYVENEIGVNAERLGLEQWLLDVIWRTSCDRFRSIDAAFVCGNDSIDVTEAVSIKCPA